MPVENAVEEALMRSIRIPPRPSLLVDLQRELAQPDPSPRRIARIIGNDVGMSGALLKLANSSFYGGRRKAKSIEQAILLLGMNQVATLMAGLLARQCVPADKAALADFWEISTQRARAMVVLARRLALGEPDVAHTFGLFCDTGIALLTERFGADYATTLELAACSPRHNFTRVEDMRHMTNHGAIGCLLARNWGLPEEVSWSILHHHDYEVIDDMATPAPVRALIAMSLLAENAIRRFQGQGEAFEWGKGGARACAHLSLGGEDIADLLDEVQEAFHAG
jgi:HD-like signal output (HDOD) protein